MFRKAILLLTPFVALKAGELYSTDFEDFTVGDNNWVGTEGWLGTENENGVSFIDITAFNGSLGKTAGLGASQPSTRRISILKPLNHDHTLTGENIIEIESLIAIRDSQNDRYDDFYFSVFNSEGARLAAIRFDNQNSDEPNSQFGIWREDGVSQFDTQVNFIHEELYDLFIRINLESNTWSADLGGIPLFTNDPFSSQSEASRNLGIVGYEWQLTSASLALYGSNFLFVGDLRVTSRDEIAEPVSLAILPSPNGVALEWQGKGGFSYQVEYSTDLKTWLDDFPNSLLSSGLSSGTITFTDASSPQAQERFYRVITKAP